MSVIKDQTPPDDDASVTPIHPTIVASSPGTTEDDESAATIRVALNNGKTAKSFKESFNTAVIIWVTQRTRSPRRRIWVPPIVVSLALLANEYFHFFSRAISHI